MKKEKILNYLVRYHHLADDAQLTSLEDISGYVKRVGCVQYDPIDVVGRNPDLVFQARFLKYRREDIFILLYEKRALLDMWDKNMSICAIEDWPYFSRFRGGFQKFLEENADAVEEITEYLQINEFACSSDFEMNEKIDWGFGVQRRARVVLEMMFYAGLLVVHHKKGARRYYGLSSRLVPEALYSMPDPNPDEGAFDRWCVRRRVNGVGALWNRPSDAFLGRRHFLAENRNRAFAALAEEGSLVPVQVEGFTDPIYIDAENLPALESAEPAPQVNARILAPLDNFLWDRKWIKALYGFDYKWKVYTPEKDRKYGYYVLPVLLGSRFIGRVELKADRKIGALIAKNFWPEGKLGQRERRKVALAVDRLMAFNKLKSVEGREAIYTVGARRDAKPSAD